MKQIVRTAILTLASFFLVVKAFSAPLTPLPSVDPIKAAFDSVTTAFTAGNWNESIRLADQFHQRWSKSAFESTLQLIVAEAELKLRNLDRASAAAGTLILQFPESGLMGRARLVRGDAALIRGDWDTARRELGWVVGFSPDTALVGVALDRLRELDDYQRYSAPAAYNEAVDSIRIALLLPSSGGSKHEAEEYLHGFLTAWRPSGNPAPLLYDTGDDPILAVNLYKKAALEDGAWAVVGGLSPAEAAPLAVASSTLASPFLTTSCGANGLSVLGSNTVQARPDNSASGEALAKYAIEDRHIKRFALIHPNDRTSIQVADAFKAGLAKAGGELLAEVTFYPGTIDYSGALKTIRLAVLKFTMVDSLKAVFRATGSIVLDGQEFRPSGEQLEAATTPEMMNDEPSAPPRLATRFLDSLWEESLRRTRKIIEATGREVDSSAIPIPALEGLMMVIEPGSIEIVAPQLARFGLNNNLFGDESWGVPSSLRKVSRYVEGMVIADPYGIPAEDSTFISFKDSLGLYGDKEIRKQHLAGERAARMILAAYQTGGHRSAFRDRLLTLNQVKTLSGRVSLLTGAHKTVDAPLFVVREGRLQHLEEVK